ncbi:cation-translocating P-type ATPase [Beduini massiliensis]|uniref:cation-translocating P-type ATPase n=2 Tax=Beduini massiliensis TaxID=1585974 RepID=UPI003564A54E
MTKSTGKLGLTSKEAKELQQLFGKNELISASNPSFLKKLAGVLCEPMFLLLLVTATIYFILGEPRDGSVMLVFVLAMISIDLLQEWKTDQTLKALKDLSSPHIQVIRDNQEYSIESVDLVPGDVMILYEGTLIPADGILLSGHDLCINESTLTGEAEPVWKTVDKNQKDDTYWRKDYCYAGTMVTQGSGYVQVEKIGSLTEYGKIGKTILETAVDPTPLQKQTKQLIKSCTWIALGSFLLVCLLTWLNVSEYAFMDRLIKSFLSGITLAMALIPEEFPVVLTVFLSMGAWRLAKKHSLVKRLPSVETLGAVSVLCVDKTGTLTQNQMAVEEICPFYNLTQEFLETLGAACEKMTYDPMEIAVLDYCQLHGLTKDALFKGELIDEYPFTNETKMMGHIWQRENRLFIAAKGSPESILSISCLDSLQKKEIYQKIEALSSRGLRVLAVGQQQLESVSQIPKQIEDCKLNFLGLIAFIDPPRPLISKEIQRCYQAGIQMIMITGDNGITARGIADQIGMDQNSRIITGEQIDQLLDEELQKAVANVNIFSRVIPNHKMRIVQALKANGEIVAMTGDGVNDAPALKSADIGIAMGKRGSEVSREAADLILLDDNFATILDTVEDGRRIYDNIKKAVNYIFTIHIPIALSSLLGPLLKISPDALLLLPIHIVLMELIIDPTCSIVLERLPKEETIMKRAPRKANTPLLSHALLLKSILQGLMMFIASFGTYYLYYIDKGDPFLARTMGMTIIIFANIFLVLVNSSNQSLVIHSIKSLFQDRIICLSLCLTLLMLGIILYTPLHLFFKLVPLSLSQLLLSLFIGAFCVFWYEGIKFYLQKKHPLK